MGDGASRIGYVPGLDGLRALAVLAVLLFHSGYGWASGGFLGVSVFFTLSGYLITTLLLAEHRRSGRVSLRSFYARRARRLLPASLLCLALVTLAWPWWTETQRADLPADILAALADVANWRFAFADASYRELFEQAASPVAHFWSLSIEEQCYLVLPLVLVACLRRGRRTLIAVLATLTVASIAAMLITDDFDLAYNGTHTRAAELLIGALVAASVAHRSDLTDRIGSRVGPSRARRAVLQVAGVAAMAALVIAVGAVAVEDRWLMRGGLAGVAVVSVILVVATVEPGPLGRVLGVPWLAAVGRVSYGLYLFHWPLFLLLTPERVGIDGLGLLGVRLAALSVCTVASYRLLEQPVRRGRVLRRPRTAGIALAAMTVGVAAGVMVAPRPAPSETAQLLAIAEAGGAVAFAPPTRSTTDRSVMSAAAAPTAAALPTVLVVGTRPVALGAGVRVVDEVDVRCSVASGDEVQLDSGAVVSLTGCRPAVDRWRAAVERADPAVVVVSLGPLDAGIVRRSGEVGFPTRDEVAAFGARTGAVDADLRAALRELAAGRRPIVLVDHGVSEWFRFTMERRAIELGGAVIVAPHEAAEAVRSLVTAQRTGAERPLRLLVVGDSSSLFVAWALHDAAGGRLEVQWAGEEGCAFVPTEATRSSPELEWAPSDCRDHRTVMPPVLESFDPDAVLVVAGAMEMLDHRYPGDPAEHSPGSPGYREHHDRAMEVFLELLDPYDVPVLVADAPPLAVGSFSVAAMTEPWRLEGWNAQIQRWAQRHDEVSVLAYADALMSYEAVHGSIRQDGSHPDLVPLTEIAEQVLVDRVLALVVPQPT